MVQLFKSETYTGTEIAEFAQYPYPLSAFQKVAIRSILEGHHVLVTAPTGSGKTLPAEFAIGHFTQLGKKVIYTSPIKALSNQKFYEFQSKFPAISFGLITGDNKINPAAQVLIMTTEILMNALFQTTNAANAAKENDAFQIDIQTELACVVFDEIHYINDAGRGHVWEKTLMMLAPLSHIQMVMLSATMDEPVRFAKWIEDSSKTTNTTNTTNTPNISRKVVVSSTEHRVVPLGHYIYMTATESLFKKLKDKATEQEYRQQIIHQLLPLHDAQGKFQETAILKVRRVQQSLHLKQVEIRRKYALNKLLEHLRDKEMLPALTFILSRKQVEQCAQEITTNLLPFDSKVPYTTADACEKLMRSKLPNWAEYTALPEYHTLVALLEKGIGIHHSGMIPVFREMVEMFISQKSIMLLIATESFSIGLDCPIKTVIFTGFRKFDGIHERLLEPHEYKQMAGRAGRRGIDTIGYSVHCGNLFPMPSMMEYRHLLSGKPEPFRSKFVVEENIVLKMVANDLSRLDKMAEFVKTSYLCENLKRRMDVEEADLGKLREQCNDMFLKVISPLATPISACNEYLSLQEGMYMASHKKQKEISREMEKRLPEFPWIKDDSLKVEKYEALKESIRKGTEQILLEEQQIHSELFKTCHFFKEMGDLQEKDEGGGWKFTELGKMAASFQEVNGLLMAELITATSWMEHLDTKQMVALFAALCWENISAQYSTVEEKDKEKDKEDLVMKSCFQILLEKYQKLDKVKSQYEIPGDVGLPSMENLTDLAGILTEWCELQNEGECRVFLNSKIGRISSGDFVKIILKIVAIKREWERVAQQFEKVDLLYKLSFVEDLICKFIATSQSLYLMGETKVSPITPNKGNQGFPLDPILWWFFLSKVGCVQYHL